MEKAKISIIFCGSCNPKINVKHIANLLVSELKTKNYDVVFNTANADFAIYLSACNCSCAFRYNDYSLPSIEINSNSLNLFDTTKEEQLVQSILAYVEKTLAYKEE